MIPYGNTTNTYGLTILSTGDRCLPFQECGR